MEILMDRHMLDGLQTSSANREEQEQTAWEAQK
jgi:hypothetical protein